MSPSRDQLERLLSACEMYSIAIIREALNQPPAVDPGQHNKATVSARRALLDAIERMEAQP